MYVEIIFLLIVLFVTIILSSITISILPYTLFIIALVLILPGILANIWAPFVPSFRKRTKIMLELANIKKGETTYDLGAGDGRIVSLAAKAGAKSFGYELSYPLVLFFWIKSGMSWKNGKVFWGNFLDKDFSDADVLFCYLFPRTMKIFEKNIYPKLKKGTRIVSNSFSIPSLKPIKEVERVFLYIKD